MTNEEFKMNVYFEKYKECEMMSVYYFKKHFYEKEGKYYKIDDLVRKIQRYQINKYGNIVGTGGWAYADNKKASRQDWTTANNRFGTKKERRARRKEHYIESKGE